ncbi:HTTM domain-containing protein [Streptomyces sp. 71268]|uniref:HTTM domain-containing protein n=1 Tax=Streptomyces sp. 71268 TaxID=3002640 RepID=UPI0023F8368F|nr:HTTM domain-containing protein [Streptomyces sp. 71268]WEV29789.1 HTTM domain-containing protein [Streptomyces sp. 71268]
MLGGRLERAAARGQTKITGTVLGPYQSAVVRIGFAFTWLLFLLREWPHRQVMYGPDSPWAPEMARQLIDGTGAFTVLMWSDGRVWFEAVYAMAVLSSALLLLGWRTRTMSVLFMVGVLSLQNRNVFVGDGGDNIIHLMAIYLVFTRCGHVWSLDARRAAREARYAGVQPSPARSAGSDTVAVSDVAGVAVTGRVPGPRAAVEVTRAPGRLDPSPGTGLLGSDGTGVVLWTLLGTVLAVVTALGELSSGWVWIFWGLWAIHAVWWAVCRYAPGEPRTVMAALGNLVHNAALVVIMGQVCLIYATAGWYKIQGTRWQDGTAVHYPLHLDYFSPWPGLTDTLGSSGTLVMLLSYGTVFVQVAFPFALLNRRAKNVLLAVMMMEHIGIAIVLGLPFLSLAMIAADAVFLPTNFLRWVGSTLRRARGRLPRRAPAPPGPDVRAPADRTLVE